MSDMMLKSFVERIENLESEIKELNQDKKDIYTEAAGSGFDKKALRAVVRLRKLDKAERDEQEALQTMYLNALGA